MPHPTTIPINVPRRSQIIAWQELLTAQFTVGHLLTSLYQAYQPLSGAGPYLLPPATNPFRFPSSWMDAETGQLHTDFSLCDPADFPEVSALWQHLVFLCPFLSEHSRLSLRSNIIALINRWAAVSVETVTSKDR